MGEDDRHRADPSDSPGRHQIPGHLDHSGLLEEERGELRKRLELQRLQPGRRQARNQLRHLQRPLRKDEH